MRIFSIFDLNHVADVLSTNFKSSTCTMVYVKGIFHLAA